MCISAAKSIAKTGLIVSILGAVVSVYFIVAAFMNLDWSYLGRDIHACNAFLFSFILLVLSLIALVANSCLISGSDEIVTRPGGPSACACCCDCIIAKIILTILCLPLAMYLGLLVSILNYSPDCRLFFFAQCLPIGDGI